MLSEGHRSKQFMMSDAISSLSLAEGSAGICNHVFVSGFVELGQDSSPPNPVLLASVFEINGLLKSGKAKIGAEQSR